MDQIEKFIGRLEKSLALKLAPVLQDIVAMKLAGYDCKKVKGFEDLFRIRVGKIRVIFRKSTTAGEPIFIEFRGSVYKKLKNR
ncbi:hypothetical protein KJ951_01755 [Patescibacteria group bacterium]|nr:hypothetical protein [Patescibacteria group bacterium]MBU1703104.1 hypothetical protein [Patescibacteria group bacterium]MBU1953739.1 hypothetical protein [Patescibacteria group bacterium]